MHPSPPTVVVRGPSERSMARDNARREEDLQAQGRGPDRLPRLVLPLREEIPFNNHPNEPIPRRVSRSPASHHAQLAPERRSIELDSALHGSRTGPRRVRREDNVQVHRRSHSQAPIRSTIDGPYPIIDGPYPNMHRRYRSSFGSNAPSTAVAAPISFETEDQKMIMRRLKHAKVKRYDGDDFGDDGDEWDDVGYYDEFGVWNGQVSTPKKAPRRVEWEAVEGGWHAVEGIASLALGS